MTNSFFMRGALSIALSIFAISNLSAQNVTYKVIADEPKLDPFVIVNLDLFQLDMGVNNLDGTSFNTGLWGIVQPVSRIGIDYNFKTSWLALGKLAFKEYPNNKDVSLGGYFILSKGTNTKNKKVTLDMKYGGDTYTTNYKGEGVRSRVQIETYIMVPSQVYRQFGVRGGYYHKSGPYNFDAFDEFPFDFDYAKISTNGLYAGLFLRKMINIFIDTEEYGVCFNSAGSDLYFDVMLLPGQSFTNLEPLDAGSVDISDDVKGALDEGTLGFRLGYKIYQMEKKTKTGKKFGMSGMFEAGRTPYQGWFVNAGIGITLAKFTKSAD